MAISRYRDALVLRCAPARTLVYQPLIPELLAASFNILLLPPREYRVYPPVTRDAFYVVALFLQLRAAYPELCKRHLGRGALLLTHALMPKLSSLSCLRT